MLKKFLIVLGGFVLVVLALGATKAAQFKAMASMSHVPPPTAVTTLEAKAVDWHTYLKAIGTLAPVQGTTLSADADGIVARIAAESGTAVQAGDLLVELDTSVETATSVSATAVTTSMTLALPEVIAMAWASDFLPASSTLPTASLSSALKEGPPAVDWLPFSAPIIMPLRMTVIPLPWWQIVGSLASVALACVAGIWVSARIYRVGMLMYGKRPTMAELAKWIRYA